MTKINNIFFNYQVSADPGFDQANQIINNLKVYSATNGAVIAVGGILIYYGIKLMRK